MLITTQMHASQLYGKKKIWKANLHFSLTNYLKYKLGQVTKPFLETKKDVSYQPYEPQKRFCFVGDLNAYNL